MGPGKNLGPDKDLGPDKNLVPNVSGGWVGGGWGWIITTLMPTLALTTGSYNRAECGKMHELWTREYWPRQLACAMRSWAIVITIV